MAATLTTARKVLELTRTLRELHQRMIESPQHYAENLDHEAQLRSLIEALLRS